MAYTPFTSCERIFLDTTVFIEALFVGSNSADSEFVRSILKELNNKNADNGRVRKFLFSDVTISELVTLSSFEQFGRKISPILNTNNAQAFPFDTDCAIWINNNLSGLLSTQEQNAFARSIGFNEHQLKMAREWITRDMMILSTAVNCGADVIFTGDRRTFKPIADRIGFPCVLTKPSSFTRDLFDNIIWEFERSVFPAP